MEMPKPSRGTLLFDRFANAVTRITGRPTAFITALGIVVVWAVSGPAFHFSETWQLVINTGTTIVTFLMVFLIQQSQNKDMLALHLKLNELIAANKGASNRLINSEALTEKELDVLRDFYVKLSALAAKENRLFDTHSVDEAERNYDVKKTHRAGGAASVS